MLQAKYILRILVFRKLKNIKKIIKYRIVLYLATGSRCIPLTSFLECSSHFNVFIVY